MVPKILWLLAQLVVHDLDSVAPAAKLFMGTSLFDAYTAVVFTRNPALSLPAQKMALLMVALVQAVRQLLQPVTRTREHVLVALTIWRTLRARLASRGSPADGYWIALLNKLGTLDPARFVRYIGVLFELIIIAGVLLQPYDRG
jgi:hypothetical protein